ncbi:MAG TPA: hypothetical protein VI032_04395 [Burkholderiaceae bacterium]
MNATADAQAAITRAMSQAAALRREAAGRDAAWTGTTPRPPVWEERARKMGFPPSPR